MTRTIKGYVCLLFGVGFAASSCKHQADTGRMSTTSAVANIGAVPSDSPRIRSLRQKGVHGQALDDIRKLEEDVRNRTYDGDRADNDFFYAGLEEQKVAEFLGALKAAVERKDRWKVASLVHYPTMVTLNGLGEPTAITSPEEFVAKYDAIMNERVLSAVEGAEVSNLFANWQGVSIGRGEIWFGGLCANGQLEGCNEFVMRITKINNHPLPASTQ